MSRYFSVLTLVLAWAGAVHAHGLLIPVEKTLPPLAMLNHKVSISIEDQVAVTKVEQTFRNHTDRQLEATYIFPVPKGANVNKFTMSVGGKEVTGELVEADKAREIYASVVRRTQDPGLLEYMGNNLLRMRVFPVPARGDQKVSLSFTAVIQREDDLVAYIYPLKTDGKATSTLEDFAITATIKSQHAVQNVYSPTHGIVVKRTNDKEVVVHFDRYQGLLDKDFQLFYTIGDKDIGLTALTHRPMSGENGYFMLLVTPKVEMTQSHQIPRDVVLVLDTSGSMRGVKMEQAKKAMRYVLDNLTSGDRFAMMNFATVVNTYKSGLTKVNRESVEDGRKWISKLEATGGTAINDAMLTALGMRTGDTGRTFNIVFFTDGMPTIGETNPDKILKNIAAKNTANTRIFTFGVGDDVNATMLDQMAEQSRAVSTYVRPAEDIEAKVSGLFSKISHPVLANLKLTATNDVSLSEIYPPQLPDLFHGQQLTVLGRYSGKGPSAIKLTGAVGKEEEEFVYEMTFPKRTNEDKEFVEHLWARRKVGYMLDQIRTNGEKKELVDEVVTLAKKYGITTPYTSYLIVPDTAVPVAGRMAGGGGLAMQPSPATVAPLPTAPPPHTAVPYGSYASGVPGSYSSRQALPWRPFLWPTTPSKCSPRPASLPCNRMGLAQQAFNGPAPAVQPTGSVPLNATKEKVQAYDQAREALARRDQNAVQAGRLGVDLSVQTNNLRNQSQLQQTAYRNVQGRNCMEIGGVWIDDQFDAKMPVVTVKAQSEAYFRIMERHPQVRDVYQLGNYVVWVTPTNTVLAIDANNGKDKLSDEEIDKLFVAKK